MSWRTFNGGFGLAFHSSARIPYFYRMRAEWKQSSVSFVMRARARVFDTNSSIIVHDTIRVLCSCTKPDTSLPTTMKNRCVS